MSAATYADCLDCHGGDAVCRRCPNAPRKTCHWCGAEAVGTGLARVLTPLGGGTELGGRFAACADHADTVTSSERKQA